MPFEIMIYRNPSPTLAEWKSAVNSVEGVELSTEDAVAINPGTGAEIRIPVQDGDAVVGPLRLRFSSFAIMAAVPTDWPRDPHALGRHQVFSLADQLGATVMTEHEDPIPRHP